MRVPWVVAEPQARGHGEQRDPADEQAPMTEQVPEAPRTVSSIEAWVSGTVEVPVIRAK
jgi:hypothetical protein